MLKSFEEYNLEKNFFSQNQKFLIAVSGGVDSMVLANIMLQSGYSFALAHCNYQLRGEESEKDQKLIEEFARGAGISLHVKRIDTGRLVQESASSIQMVAREERYKFFDSLMEEHGYDLTLLAHNADDRIESLLMNILRGTGFRGFQGMPIRRGQYVRPLSFARKNEIREFAKQNQISYREDSSNSEIYYQRNWVRLRLLPMLRNHDTEIKSKLLSFIHQSEEKLPECEKLVSEEVNTVKSSDATGFSVQQLKKSAYPFTLLKGVLSPLGFSSGQIFEVIDLLQSNSGSFVEAGNTRVIKNREELLIQDTVEEVAKPKLKFEEIQRSDLVSFRVPENETLLDASLVEEEKLTLRQWRQGDRFKQLGMNGWKKLSDFFIDQKLSVLEKEKVWLLTHKEDIIWVVGMRLDDRFKITSKTQNVLKVTAYH